MMATSDGDLSKTLTLALSNATRRPNWVKEEAPIGHFTAFNHQLRVTYWFCTLPLIPRIPTSVLCRLNLLQPSGLN